MLQLRNLLPLLRSPPPSPSRLFSLHRLLATATADASPFVAEDYLVTRCRLTRAQARKASKSLSRLKSPSNPDAVLAFLSAHGLSRADVAALVAADPNFLYADVDTILSKRVAELGAAGLSRPQIARLIPIARRNFRTRSVARNVEFWLPVYGSFDKLLQAVKVNATLLTVDLDKLGKPNLELLQQCGIKVCDFPGTFLTRVLTSIPEHVQDAVEYIEKLGVPRRSPMFRHALLSFAMQSKEKVAEKIGTLEKLGWSRDDVLLAVKTMPNLLTMSERRLRRNVEFLMRDVGLDIPYIARRPALVLYSLERRLLPRHWVLKALNAKGLLTYGFDFYSTAAFTEEQFVNRFVSPYEKSFPGLADAYAAHCAGKVPDGVTI